MLMRIQCLAETAPVGPVFLLRINHVGVIVSSEMKSQEIFFRETGGDVELGVDLGL